MAFRFSLVALLRLRLTLEQVEERKLMSLRHDAQRFELAIDQTVAERRGQRLRQAALLAGANPMGAGLSGGRPTGADLQFSDSCLMRLDFDEQQLRQRLVAKQEEIQRRLALFTDARRQREAIESLRDGQLELYREEERRRDQRNLDDLFLQQLLLARQGRAQG